MRPLLARLTTLVATVAATLGCGAIEGLELGLHQKSVKGTGPVEKQSRKANSFKSIRVGGPFEVVLTKSAKNGVTVEAQKSLLSHIKTSVEGGELVVKAEEDLNTDKPLRLYISAPSLNGIDVSGACQVKSDSWKASSFKLEISGASKASIPLEVDRLEAEISGASEVTLRGNAKRLELDLSGASSLKASDLRIGDARIEASGASQADLRVSGSLSGEASGASNVRYRGNPRTQIESSGAASVEKG